MSVSTEKKIKDAVKFFWSTRRGQAARQGSGESGADRGGRGAVTGGHQMDGFEAMVRDLLVEGGVPAGSIYSEPDVELPGFFRPEKKWDFLVVHDGKLLAAIEFKSQVGPSFGNNFNNRTEEALGNATDIWIAFRENAFKSSVRPWLGFLMLLEKAEGSTRPVKSREPHFPVFNEFKDASYSRRYELLIDKLMKERLYDRACLIMSEATAERSGRYEEPNSEMGIEGFLNSLLAHMAVTFPKK